MNLPANAAKQDEGDEALPTWGALRNWVWITGVGVAVGIAFFWAGVWVASAEDSHEKTAHIAVKQKSLEALVLAVQQQNVETRKENEVSAAVLAALCTDPRYVASPVCASLRLRRGNSP